MILYACSSNAGKLAEFALAAEQAGAQRRQDALQIAPLPGLKQITAPEETGRTFEENAVLKALYYSSFSEQLVFADDSGLAVDALGDAPGVFSARFAGPAASDEENNALLLKSMAGREPRNARFITAIALAQTGKLLTVAHGQVAGEILNKPRGSGGFGYDPLFFYPPLQRSFGELSDPEKFAVSARGNATRNLLAWFLVPRYRDKR
jgi:XTP/dITP diphosphohydrolase